MARIAIAVGIGVLGALTGGIGAGLFGIGAGTMFGGSILAGVIQGAAIGFSAGNPKGGMFAGQILNREKDADETETSRN